MPAFMPAARSPISISPRTGPPTKCATRSTRKCGRIRSACWPASKCRDDFDARFSATARHYSIASSTGAARSRSTATAPGRWCTRSMQPPCTRRRRRLVGHHDFTTFRSAECQADSPVKTLDRLDVTRAGEDDRQSRRRPAPSCTIRCARWSARSSWSARASGRPPTSNGRSTRAIAAPAARWRPLSAFTSAKVDY